MKKHNIEVRGVAPGNKFNSAAPYTVLATIQRKLWSEVSGNFNPVFCRYQGKRELVHSEQGDLSDPFRREESYLEKLFIRVEVPGAQQVSA